MMTRTKKWIDYCCQAHCQTCRKAITGFQFRCDISKKFILPENNINFTCPHGKEWTEEYKVPLYEVDKITLQRLNADRILSLEELEVIIKEMNSEYLNMKLEEAKNIIEMAECSSCVSVARRKDLLEKIYIVKEQQKNV